MIKLKRTDSIEGGLKVCLTAYQEALKEFQRSFNYKQGLPY